MSSEYKLIDVPWCPKYYAVTICGKVWSKRKERFLIHNAKLIGSGIKCSSINLCHDGGMECIQLGNLIARVFLPNPNNYKRVMHLDGNPVNCSVENLRWIHPREIRLGKSDKKKKVHLLPQEREEVRQWVATGLTHWRVANAYNVSTVTVDNICREKV